MRSTRARVDVKLLRGAVKIPWRAQEILAFPLILSMRGTLGERNPSQMPLGRATVGMLEALGVQTFPLRVAADAAKIVRGAVAVAEGARVLAPVLLEAELEL